MSHILVQVNFVYINEYVAQIRPLSALKDVATAITRVTVHAISTVVVGQTNIGQLSRTRTHIPIPIRTYIHTYIQCVIQ